MKVGALFAGYGGIELALSEVFDDVHPAWFAEIEDAPSRILAHHWPDVPNLGDVTRVDWTQVEPVDVICGGSPCQDVSMAGARKGMRAGTRSGLWASMCDAIEAIRPRLVVWENVRGALSAGADSRMEPCDLGMGCEGSVPLRALGRVLGDLAELGYDAGWEVVRASDIGAPHRRERVFVVAEPTDQRHERRGIARDGWAGPADGGHADLTLLPTPRATDGTKGGPNQRGSSGDLMLPSAVQLLPTPVTADSHGHVQPGTLAGEAVYDTFGQYASAITRWEAVLGRAAPAPTEPNAAGNRRLSVRFVEWMMGLPEGHVVDVPGITRNQALKALGNGVVPQQATHAIRRILAATSAWEVAS